MTLTPKYFAISTIVCIVRPDPIRAEDTEGKNYKTGLEGLMKSRFPLMLIKPLVDSVISVSSVSSVAEMSVSSVANI